MPYRGRHRKRSRSAYVFPPAVIAVAGLWVGAASGYETHSPQPAADVRALGQQGPLAPFAADPSTIPYDGSKAVPPKATVAAAHGARRHHQRRPAASGPVVLPAHLDVSAATIPRRVLASYVNAARLADKASPQCDLRWQTVAAIGFIESDNARSGGSAQPHWDGVANPPIYGPMLDGQDGVAAVPDTDGASLDGSSQWDRAVGPMQFIPSTWERYAADGNHDGTENPQQIDDATLAAADYLCATGPDLSANSGLIRAVYAYNHSYTYVKDVLTVQAHYMDIDPAALGINGLPSDHKHKHHKRHDKPPVSPTASPTGSPTPTPTRTPSASPTPSTSASAASSASPTASPTPSGSASPTASATTAAPDTAATDSTPAGSGIGN